MICIILFCVFSDNCINFKSVYNTIMASSGGLSLSSLLPAPTQNHWDRDEARAKQQQEGGSSSSSTSLVSASRTAPPYGKRKGWVPRTVDDFGDGGSYPEIHVAQYPLGKDVPLIQI